MQKGWHVFIYMTVIVLVISIIYVYLLKFFAKPLLYISIAGMLLFLVFGGLFCFVQYTNAAENTLPEVKNGFLGGAASFWILALLMVAFILCYREAIKLGAAILQASSDFVSSNNRIILLPLINYVLMIIVTLCWGVSVLYLGSKGKPSYVENSYISNMEYENTIVYVFLFMLFGLFWILAFIGAIEKFVIAATTSMWYFSGEGSDEADRSGRVSLLLGTKWAFKYHLGTMAFGSFLVAFMNMVKVIFEYFAKQAENNKATDNNVVKAFICLARCCIWCIDSFIRFINAHAYIQCAIFSTNFCDSAKAGFYMSIRNASRFTALSLSSFLLTIVGKGLVTALNVFICYLIIGAMGIGNAPVFCFLVGIIAFFVSSIFMEIYEFSSQTILHCFVMDSEIEGPKQKTPDSLRPFLESASLYESKQSNDIHPSEGNETKPDYN